MQKSEISWHWRTSVPVRLLATSVAAACGVVGLGVLGAQSASADVPGYGISGVTDSALGGCTGTGVHWQGPDTFDAAADLTVPSGVAFPEYHFKVVQAKTAAPVYASDGEGYSGTVRMSVPTTSFVDGGSYSWTIGLDLPDGTTQWSAPCTFKVDVTPPPAPTVALTDGYGDTPPPRRTPRTVTFSVPAGSGATDFCYSMSQISYGGGATPCGGNKSVKVGKDGTATVTVVPIQPGENVLDVWTADRAHNWSQPDQFDIYMGWGTEDQPGDLNGDAKVDLFAVKGAQLELLAGQGDGRVSKATVTSAGGDLTGAQLGRIGDASQNGNNSAYILNGGALYLGRADGIGDLTAWSYIAPPQSDPFGDDSGSTAAGPGVDMANWSTVTQITGAVNVMGDGQSGFFALNSGRIQYFPARSGWMVQLPLTIARAGTDTSLVAAQDFNGDGKVDLLVRKAAHLRLFAGNGDGTFAAATAYAKGLNVSRYTQIVSDGDANGDKLPDLWATTAAGKLVFLAGTGSSGFARPVRASGQDMTGVSIF